MNVDIVIGAGYGDEGKGLTTDALASRSHARGETVCVVRYNGGAQAGHTVERPDGKRHVFHHFGAGALAGAATHLGQRFVIQPMLFSGERAALESLNANLSMTIDPRAIVTFPCDVAINQALEQQRAGSRHGSCGVGFGEAVHRNETGHPSHRLTLGELSMLSIDQLYDRWKSIASTYVPSRLSALELDPSALSNWDTTEVFDRFVSDCQSVLEHAALAMPGDLPFNSWILEGAQGLAIDEDLGDFPFVTRSKTGLPWALEFLNQLSSPSITATAWYLTRAYTTRHGAGPIPHVSAWLPPGFQDITNQPNPFQGALRVAPLDTLALSTRISKDIARSKLLTGRVQIHPALSVSCLDQMNGSVLLSDGRSLSAETFAQWLADRFGMARVMESWGPTYQTFRAQD